MRRAVRCGDCGQRVVEVHNTDDPMVEERYIRCPDAIVPWGGCGMDPLTLERRDGPRWAQALRGLSPREIELSRTIRAAFARRRHVQGATPEEREHGIPEGWFGR